MLTLSSGNFMYARREAPAARRNASAILDVLRRILPESGTVLEIGSGTGQHAAAFASALTPRSWLPSDPDPDQRASIASWIAEIDGAAPLPPRDINAASADWDVRPEDGISAIVTVNVVHISPWAVCQGLVAGAGRLLPTGGVLYLYGPFKRAGQHTAPSNAVFDATLQARNPEWGIRNLEDIATLGEDAGLFLDPVIDMPSNNFSLVFRRL
jgi:SAM-dependent methyltransferase